MGNITDPLHDYNLRAFPNLDPPVVELEVIGSSGSTTYTYVATFETIVGETTASAEASVTDGPDTLSSSNKVRVTCETVPAACETINVFKKVGSEYHFLGSCDADTNQVDDIGQSLDDEIQPPTTNDSGRNTWAFLGFHNNRCLQRPELMDMQGIFHRWVRDVADTIFRDGDQVSGCAEQNLGSNEWQFTDGEIYLQGLVIDVTSDSVQLTGTGTELVGVWITPSVVTYTTDPKIRNIDEGVGDTFNMEGADRIIIEATWGLSDDTPPTSDSFFVLVKEFEDGSPRTVAIPPEQSRLDERIARQRHDTSGSFVVRNFPVKIVDHDTDSTKVYAKVNAGKAYPEGYEVETIAPQFVEIPKARDTASVNNSAVGAFVHTGGYVIGTTSENFDVDGLKITVQIGSGTDIIVTFSGNGQTAAQVATQIETVVNAVPSAGEPDIITCSDASGSIKLQAQDGKSLTLKTVSGDAYTVLGLTDTKPATYEATGTRIYKTAEPFVKAVTDINYGVEIVEQLTHDGGDHIDELGNTGVYDIVGAADASADCHDSNFDYLEGVDFERIGNTISFAGMGGSEPGNGATYYAKYRYNHNATKGTRALVRVTDATITKGAAGGKDYIVFTGGTAKKIINNDPVTGLSGNASDVVKVERVNDSSGQSVNDYPYQYKLVSNSDELEHGDSEIDWSLSTDEPSTSSTYYVTFLFWYHEVEGDVVVADSYDRYEAITLAPDRLTELRDCLDFRTDGGAWPIDGDPPVFDYDYYLSRIDKLNLTKDGIFTRVPGAPAKYPTGPKEPSTGVCTHAIIVPPYTYRNDTVNIQSLEALRITQRGLNEILHRVERLEYYASMKVLEDKAASYGTAEEAKGLFFDAITGQNRMDPQFYKLGVYHNASIDRFHNCFRLPVSEQGVEITINEAASSNIARVGRVIMFDYTETVFQQQPYASDDEYVNPDEVFSWVGTLTIDPEEDFYNDQEQVPSIQANVDGNWDALINYLNAELARQITWGAWNRTAVGAMEYYETMIGQYMVQTASGARRIDTDAYYEHEEANRDWRALMPDGGNLPWVETQSISIGGSASTTPMGSGGTIWDVILGQQYLVDRLGEYKQLFAEQQTVDLGDRVVDVSLELYCRTKHHDGSPYYINCIVDGMLPSNAVNGDIDVGCEIDGIAVDMIATGTSEQGASSYKGKDTIKLTSMGDATFKFVMPEGVPIGSRQVKVVWVTDPSESWCSAIFQSVGLRSSKSGTTLGFQSLAERTEKVEYKCGYQHTTVVYGMVDPLAQTFRVDSGPVYISSIEVYFAGKDSTLPVTVEIHDTLNGYPQPNIIQTCTLPPSSVNVTSDGSTSTKFTFENIVGYEPGEYCIVIRANSLNYKVFVAELGGIDILTGNVIGSQAHWGVLFHSPNASTWEPWTKRDLKFKINQSNFENDCQIVFDQLTGIQASYLCALVTQFLPLGCDMKWYYSMDGGSTYTKFNPGLDTELGSVATTINLRVDVTATGGTFQLVEKYMGIVLLLNELNANYVGRNGTLDPNDPCNQVTIYVDLETDGVNGSGTRSVTPYFSVDDGIRWVEVEMPTDYEILATTDKRMYEYKFQTPGQATVSDATNATPIVITSSGHGFKDNSIVYIQNVGGNTAANGVRLLKNCDADTMELYDPDTENAIAGNGSYTSGGTVDLEDFTQCRVRFYLETSNRAVTPRGRNIRAICS